MNKLNLKEIYIRFIRQKIDEKWLSKFNHLVVLGENFLNGYYIVVFEVNDSYTIMEEVFSK